MAEPEKKKQEMLSEEEMLKLLLIEDETFKDEGRDVYMEEVIIHMRKKLETDSEEKDE
ncbi:MAG: hypothetical protein IK043_02850 [Candidatus Methanomethylophilaceae archaeon]|nr:hypothetical protein [Methanomethylophilus sp.]MBR5999359.1 hypothetical protein [Candidatus Methanomethylophilaceae archaeon]